MPRSRAVTEAQGEANLLYTPFREMNGIAPQRREALRAEALRVIREAAQPAYAQLLKFMREEYVPGLRTTIAAEALPDGKAYYRAKIREFTTLDMEPGGDPRTRRRGGRAAASGHDRRHAGERLQGRLRRVPEVPAHAIRASTPGPRRNC